MAFACKLLGIIFVGVPSSLPHVVAVSSASIENDAKVLPNLLRREAHTSNSKLQLASDAIQDISAVRQSYAGLKQHTSAIENLQEPPWPSTTQTTTTTTTVNSWWGNLGSGHPQEYPLSSMFIGIAVGTFVMVICQKLGGLFAKRTTINDEHLLSEYYNDQLAQIHKLREAIYELRGFQVDPDLLKKLETIESLDEAKDLSSAAADDLLNNLSKEAERFDPDSKERKALMACVERVQDLTKAEMVHVVSKTTQFGKELASHALEGVDGVFDDNDSHAEKYHAHVSRFVPPPLSLIIGGTTARKSIVAIYESSTSRVYYCAIMFGIIFAVLTIDGWVKSCDTQQRRIRGWAIGLLIILIAQLITYQILSMRCAFEIEMDDLEFEENDCDVYEHRRISTFSMLFKLTQLEDSKAFKIGSMLSIIRFVWDLFAVQLALFERFENMSPKGDGACSSKALVGFMNIYTAITLSVLLFGIYDVLTHILFFLRGTRCCAKNIVSILRTLDRDAFYEIPVLTTLLRSFWLRDKAGMCVALLAESKARIKKLDEVVQLKEDALEEHTRQREHVTTLHDEVQKLDEGWLHGYNDKIGRSLVKLSPFVTFACQANVMQENANKMKELSDAAKENAANQMRTLSEAVRDSDVAKTISESAAGAARTLRDSDVASTLSESAVDAAKSLRESAPEVAKTMSESVAGAANVAKNMSESAAGAAKSLRESEVGKTMSESAAGAAGAAMSSLDSMQQSVRGGLSSVPESPTEDQTSSKKRSSD